MTNRPVSDDPFTRLAYTPDARRHGYATPFPGDTPPSVVPAEGYRTFCGISLANFTQEQVLLSHFAEMSCTVCQLEVLAAARAYRDHMDDTTAAEARAHQEGWL